jgi:uncharacterized protein YdhG (YjbR/CyaY superfamily)
MTKTTTQGGGWTDEERAAMKAHAEEMKRAGGKGAAKAADEAQACLDKIAEMADVDRDLAERVHAIVTTTVSDVVVKTYYGMPAYARNGRVVCFFKPASKFNVRYATFGFEDEARIDDGQLFPASFGVKDMTKADEARLVELIKKA